MSDQQFDMIDPIEGLPEPGDRDPRTAWTEDAPNIIMAALGRAEHDLNNDPLSRDFAAQMQANPDAILFARMGMMAVLTQARAILFEAGWLDYRTGKQPLPDDIRKHGEQGLEAYTRAGLV